MSDDEGKSPQRPESLRYRIDRIPYSEMPFAIELEDGTRQSGVEMNMGLVLSIGVEEVGLSSDHTERLRSGGFLNLGHLASAKRERVSSVVRDERAMDIVDWQLNEAGFVYDMQIEPSLISDQECKISDLMTRFERK